MKSLGKVKIFAMLGLSMLAVTVGMVSTFAWFQLTVNGADPSHSVTSGSMDLDVKMVRSHKFNYAETSDSTVNYDYGYVSSTLVEGVDDEVIKTEDLVIDFDIPEGGDGYYLFKSNVSKFSGAIQLSKKEDTAVFSASLTTSSANETFTMKHHYFASNGETKNLSMSSLTLQNTDSSIATVSSGTVTVKTEGTYTVWLNQPGSDNAAANICIEPSFSVNTANRALAHKRDSVSGEATRKNKTTLNSIYSGELFQIHLKPSSEWKVDGARFAAYFCNAPEASYGTGNKTDAWIDLSDTDGDGTYSGTVPLSSINCRNVIFCRMNGDTTENNWTNRWTQTGDLALFSNFGRTCTISGSGGDKAIWSGTYSLANKCIAVGSFANYNNGWSWYDGILMPTSSGNYGEITNLSVTSSDKFKVAKISSSGVLEHYPYNNNNNVGRPINAVTDSLGGNLTISDYFNYVDSDKNVQPTGAYTIDIRITTSSQFTIDVIYRRITMTPVYYLSDGTTKLTLSATPTTHDLLKGSTFSASVVTPSSQFGANWKVDSSKGILYYFEPSTVWYKTDECDNVDSNVYNEAPTAANTTVYVKMTAKWAMTTIYINSEKVNWAPYIFWYQNAAGSDIRYEQFACKPLLTNKMYRVSFPVIQTATNGGYFIHNNASNNAYQSGNNRTPDIKPSPSAGTYFLIKTDTDNNNNRKYSNPSDFSISGSLVVTSRIARSNGTKTMNYAGYAGAGTSPNVLAYENGLLLNAGDTFYIHYNGKGDWAEDSSTSATTSSSDTVDEIATTIFTIKKDGRYTFYLTHDNTIAVANVPIQGNGYYIMQTTGTSYTSFDDGLKMREVGYSGGVNIAYYKNLNISGTKKIYVRGYVDNVDTLYDGHMNKDKDSHANYVSLSTGTYNVYLYKTNDNPSQTYFSVTATTGTADSPFMLNLIRPHAGTPKMQNTAIVLEVAFTISNADKFKVSVMKSGSIDNVGAALVDVKDSTHRIRDTDMETLYYKHYVKSGGDDVETAPTAYPGTLTTADGLISGSPGSLLKNDGNTFYAYILIDYISQKNAKYSPSGSMSFRMKMEQFA